MGRQLLVVLAALALAGCVSADEPSADIASTPPAPTTSTPTVLGLTCTSNQRSAGIIDNFSNGGGAPSVEAAVRTWADGDEVVVGEEGRRSAVVWVLRNDGTAHTKLGLRRFSDGTWTLEQVDACAGRGEDPGPGA